eukprot:Phypoly_transcript_15894.p1 GENE.Phypoly_transcript_15894~~Phypoly_transcript_15894.p1  ORF type:complete len:235 (+),score=32.23 Phypoly_transcript_15894:33-737(+)
MPVSVPFAEILPGLKLFSQYLSSNSKGEKYEGPKNQNKTAKKPKGESKTTKSDSCKLSADSLLATVKSNYPFTRDLNQVMAFGILPDFILPLIEQLQSTADLFPADMQGRQPLFDQMICNFYEPGQGITPHVDLLSKFADGIVIVSLGSTCVMDFRPVVNIEEAEKYSEKKDQKDEGTKISVLLRPGDVLSICGDARYKWTHGIEKKEVDEWEGKSIPRGQRVSITLRRLLPQP